MKPLVIVPAYRLEGVIGTLLSRIREIVPQAGVVAIDDGSGDGTSREAAAVEGVTVITHPENRGKGAALRTGFEHALAHGFDPLITIDGDGQHPPEVIPQFLDRAEESDADIVIGARPRKATNMPWDRRFANRVTSWIASRLARCEVPDIQSGYRLIRAHVLQRIELTTTRYEMETELIVKAGRAGMLIESIPIPTVYAEERSHIVAWKDTLRWLRLLWKLR